MSFPICIRYSIGWEAGRVDNPKDRGGRTAYGITQRTYDAWRRSRGSATQDVWNIVQPEVDAIYRDWYWRKVWGDEMDRLDPRLAFLLLDAAIHHGCGQSVKWLQRALHAGLATDGIPGAHTLTAAHRVWDSGMGDESMREAVESRRKLMHQIVERDASQQRFLNGWLNRAADIEAVISAPAEDFAATVAKHQRQLPRGYV